MVGLMALAAVTTAGWLVTERRDARTRVQTAGPHPARVLPWRRQERDDGLVVLRELSRSLASTGELITALNDAACLDSGPVARRLAVAMAAIAAGRPATEELDRLAERDDDPVRVGLWAALASARGTGGALRPAVDRAVEARRELEQLRKEARTQAGQAIASAAVLAGSPALFLGLFAVVDPTVPTTLVTSMAGRVCLVGALLLDGVGLWWIRSVLRQVLT